jgi:hypothetical protein
VSNNVLEKIVTCKFSVEAMHQWRDAPVPFEYLQTPHRHVFYFQVAVVVSGSNREVEFIDLGHKCRNLVYSNKFWNGQFVNSIMFWGSRSCEMLAEDLGKLLNEYKLAYITVSEDNENFAGVTYRRE